MLDAKSLYEHCETSHSDRRNSSTPYPKIISHSSFQCDGNSGAAQRNAVKAGSVWSGVGEPIGRRKEKGKKGKETE